MILTFLKRFGWLWIGVFIQALILNNVHIMGYATPFLYVYFILKLNADTSRHALLLWGFSLGLAVDIFSNTPGINAAATTLLALTRPAILNLFAPRDSAENFEPGSKSMGIALFMRYIITGLFIHQTALLTLESFSFSHPQILLLKIISSILLTSLCVWAVERFKKE